MIAYVYVKSLNDYKYVKSSKIDNFEFENYGHQPRDFAKKVFKVNERDGTDYSCQILIVADTIKEVDKYIAESRPKVPKLNDSDFPKVKENNCKAIVLREKQVAMKARKDRDINKKRSRVQTSAKIVSDYQKTLECDSDEPSNAASEHPSQNEEDSDNDDEDKNKDEYESDDQYFKELPTNKMSPTDKTKSYNKVNQSSSTEPKSNLSQNYSQKKDPLRPSPNETHSDVLPNNFNNEENNENLMPNLRNNQQKTNNPRPSDSTTQVPQKRRLDTSDLELALQDEKRKRIRAEIAMKKLYDQGNILKKKVAELTNNKEADDAEKRVFELKRKALPTIINTKSGVFAKRSAVEDVYKKKEPSHFCINMFYAVWGFDALAQRCVVRSKKTGTLRPLTPRKKLAVEHHFENMLNYYHDNQSLISYYINRINNYANRAINGAKKKLKAIEEYPEIDMEGIEDDEKIEL